MEICRKYAKIVVKVWDALCTEFAKKITFESMCAALLYHMRRGLAYDGIYIIPPILLFLFQVRTCIRFVSVFEQLTRCY